MSTAKPGNPDVDKKHLKLADQLIESANNETVRNLDSRTCRKMMQACFLMLAYTCTYSDIRIKQSTALPKTKGGASINRRRASKSQEAENG